MSANASAYQSREDTLMDQQRSSAPAVPGRPCGSLDPNSPIVGGALGRNKQGTRIGSGQSSDALEPEQAEVERGDSSRADGDRQHLEPALWTSLLREAVPALRATQWRVLETGDGYARAILPLIDAATNHQGTHQGALMLLAAEFTGGIALASIFRGFPVVGVHAQPPGWRLDRAAIWLAKAEITYHVPSTADLVVTCRVPGERIGPVHRRFMTGATVLMPLDIDLDADGVRVATARLTYYARRSSFIRPSAPGDRPHALYVHQVKSSTRLIAGVRAMERLVDGPLFEDPYSAQVARAHGRLLAAQFSAVLPQLRPMVAARTRDADDCLLEAIHGGTRQVVVLGAGLDCRPFRLLGGDQRVTVFEVDLPSVLAERQAALALIPELPPVLRAQVALDFRQGDVADALLSTPSFNPEAPTVFFLEGVSMYLESPENVRLLRSVARLMQHPRSRLWLDTVAESVVAGASGYAEIDAFVQNMARLGEPFAFGIDDASAFFKALDFEVQRSATAASYHRGEDSLLFGLYRFHYLSLSRPARRAESTDRRSRPVPVPAGRRTRQSSSTRSWPSCFGRTR
jgi:methyltransferase (TIGR00027 family)